MPEGWPIVGIMTGGQPLTKSLAYCVGKACQLLMCIYGSLEILFCTQANITDPNDFVEFSTGKPLNLPGLEIKIVDENAREDKKGDIRGRLV